MGNTNSSDNETFSSNTTGDKNESSKTNSNGNNEEQEKEAEDENTPSCAICFGVLGKGVIPASMPCCERKDGTTKFCIRCLELVCERSSDGKTGRCPKCKAHICVRDGSVRISDPPLAKCDMCLQMREIVTERTISFGNGLCSACSLGAQQQIRYECKGCGCHQAIPHPMYRYQETEDKFGTATWACHQRCGDYRVWKIVPEDIGKVPVSDVPESWGWQERVLDDVRQARRVEMEGNES